MKRWGIRIAFQGYIIRKILIDNLKSTMKNVDTMERVYIATGSSPARHRKFTCMSEEVQLLWFYQGENSTNWSRNYKLWLPKSSPASINWHQYNPNYILTCPPAPPKHRRHVNLEPFVCGLPSMFLVFLKLL
jgi:hypothetical protein